jgi:3-hydroxyacyl-CoA dehydrogenase / 3-hydroxy-2-methylbutyryl-CoA dehydrogenase
MDLTKSTAIITGGASGLGEATAGDFVKAGAQVAILDVDREKGIRVADEMGKAVKFYAVDITQEKEMDETVTKIREAFGTFHIVVNCAGIGASVKIVSKDGIMPLKSFNHLIQVNLVGTFNVIRATASTLMQNTPNKEGERGVYINTASIAAFDGQIGQAGYSSSKGGVVSMTLTLTREFANDGIRVMTILPGIMDTPMLAKQTQELRDRLARQIPFPTRLGKPEEFASLAHHIVQNNYLNGEFIRLDGGLRMGFYRK